MLSNTNSFINNGLQGLVFYCKRSKKSIDTNFSENDAIEDIMNSIKDLGTEDNFGFLKTFHAAEVFDTCLIFNNIIFQFIEDFEKIVFSFQMANQAVLVKAYQKVGDKRSLLELDKTYNEKLDNNVFLTVAYSNYENKDEHDYNFVEDNAIEPEFFVVINDTINK